MAEEATKKNNSVTTVGRRKEAIARVRLMSGQGQITVNGKPIAEYFLGPIFQKLYSKPMEVSKTLGKYTVTVKVETFDKMIVRKPIFVIEHAVAGMLPGNKLGKQMIKKLTVFAGEKK